MFHNSATVPVLARLTILYVIKVTHRGMNDRSAGNGLG